MPLRGLMALVAAGAVLAGPAAAGADTTTGATDTAPPPTTTTVPATTETSPPEPTTTAPTETTPPTTVPATTVTLPTTTAESTTATGTTTAGPDEQTTATSAPRTSSTRAAATSSSSLSSAAATATSSAFWPGCPLAAVAVLLPGRQPLLVGPVADTQVTDASISSLSYPAGGSIVTGKAVSVGENGCAENGPEGGRAQIRTLSLFAGAVRAARVSLAVGQSPTGAVAGLTVGGRSTGASTGRSIPLQHWGYLVVGMPKPLTTTSNGAALSVLAVHLLEPHAGLPAGATVLVSAAGFPAAKSGLRAGSAAGSRAGKPKARKKGAKATHEPLRVTPPLGESGFIFPVVGETAYVDTYGAYRSDVPGNWHHGDDIFAPLGAPIVAVASGTINRVGWEHVGGWRLWVRDSAGDEFYYAHLSGYTPSDLRSNRVHAGEVIGFIGNTGDAFTTSPHLHFEIHPRQLLHLGYDGAVDPTSYIDRWKHVAHVRSPHPTHPRLPRQPALRQEARYVFRELLAARHLISHGPKPSERPHVEIPPGANGRPYAAPLPPPETTPSLADAGTAQATGHWVLLAVAVLLAGLASFALIGARTRALPALRRRSGGRTGRASEAGEDRPAAGEDVER